MGMGWGWGWEEGRGDKGGAHQALGKEARRRAGGRAGRCWFKYEAWVSEVDATDLLRSQAVTLYFCRGIAGKDALRAVSPPKEAVTLYQTVPLSRHRGKRRPVGC